MDRDALINAIKNSSSMNVLSMIGDTLRILKATDNFGPDDELFLSECRVAFANQRQFLLREAKKNGRVRQQHDGDHLAEQKARQGYQPTLPGELRDQQ